MSLQDAQDKSIRQFTNLLNKDILQQNIMISALLILVFESFKDLVIDRLRDLYCLPSSFEEDNISIKDSNEYKQKVRSLDKNIFDASLKWFQNQEALSDSDKQIIKQAEKRRNDIAHDLFSVLANGLSQEDISIFLQLIQIYDNLDSWWVYNIEADWDEIPNPESVEQKDCHSSSVFMLHIILDILSGNADQYADWPERLRATIMKKRSQMKNK